MKTFLLLASIALASGKPAGEGMSLKAEVLPDVKSSSAPAYWSAQCGDHTYAASYTLMMDWANCRDYCTYFPHSVELGYTFSFADIMDVDTMECLRFNMNNQYTPGNGYDGHYWAGGYRGEDGQYRWDSGAVFEFDDFVGNPGEDPYIHLTPGNNYQWNTKNDQDDRNNGCLCKSQELAKEVDENSRSVCPVGWYSVGKKCIRWTPNNKITWWKAYDYCQHLGAEMVTWRSEGEFITLQLFMFELYQITCPPGNAPNYCPGLSVWTGANLPKWSEWNDIFFNNNTMDFVPMDYGWAPGKPDMDHKKDDICVKFFQDGTLDDFLCNNYDVAPFCQAL